MLEVIRSQTEQPVLRRDGMFLSSGFDPVKEAEMFLEPYRKWCEAKPTFVIFGAGSGYHIKLLAERYPEKQIFLIEFDLAVVSAIKELHPLLKFDHKTMITDELISRLKCGAVLIRHLPSWVGHEADFESAWIRCKGPHVLEVAQRIEVGPKPYRDEDILWLCLRELFK